MAVLMFLLKIILHSKSHSNTNANSRHTSILWIIFICPPLQMPFLHVCAAQANLLFSSLILDFTATTSFLPARVLAVVVRLCVCLSVTRRYCVKTAKHIASREQRHVIAQGSSFLTPKVVGGPRSIPLKFALKVTHPLSNTTISTNISS